METSGKHHTQSALKIPMIISWSLFGLHFIYIGVFHGFMKKYISIWDIIIDVILLFSLEAISVLLTLSNKKDNLIFFKISFVISIVNIVLILFYIFVVVFIYFVKDKMEDLIKPEDWPKDEGRQWHGVVLILIKIFETFPLFAMILSQKKFEGPAGVINKVSGIWGKEREDEAENELE